MESVLSSRLLNSRGGTLLLGGLAAVLAAIVVLVYVSQYRNNVNAGNSKVKVLVSRSFIEKGTPGNYIGRAELFAPQAIIQKQVLEGAITDPGVLRARVALHDINPGEQLTLADFTAPGVDTLPTNLARGERAVGFSIDASRGLVGNLAAGDHVDVYGIFNVDSIGRCGSGPVLKLIMQNALIMRFPGAVGGGIGGGSRGQTVVLRANYQQAANIALTADTGRIYLLARPSANARPTPPQLQTVQQLLLGVPPVTVSSRCVGARG
jgi:Flp pilus assembly protein CpaB